MTIGPHNIQRDEYLDLATKLVDKFRNSILFRASLKALDRCLEELTKTKGKNLPPLEIIVLWPPHAAEFKKMANAVYICLIDEMQRRLIKQGVPIKNLETSEAVMGRIAETNPDLHLLIKKWLVFWGLETI